MQFLFKWSEHSAVLYFPANEADGNIESDAIHPGGERARGVVFRPRSPKLRRNLLRKIIAIFGTPTIRVDGFEDDEAMLLEQCFKVELISIRQDATRPQSKDVEMPQLSNL